MLVCLPVAYSFVQVSIEACLSEHSAYTLRGVEERKILIQIYSPYTFCSKCFWLKFCSHLSSSFHLHFSHMSSALVWVVVAALFVFPTQNKSDALEKKGGMLTIKVL